MKVMKTPRSLDLEITTRCNLRCSYCSHFTSGGDVEDDLPTHEWLTFFEELGRCAVMDVTLQGGEPLLREDFTEIVEGIVRNRMRLSILTNGTLITDSTAALLKSTGRCDSIQVSIDGSMPTTHDAFRGDGSFGRAVNGLKVLLDHGLPATVRVTIHRKNLHDLEAVAKMLLEDAGLPGFSTNSASLFGLCRKNSDMVQLTPEERSQAMEKLLELNRKYEGRISAMAGPLAEARTWIRLELAIRNGLDHLPNGGFLKGCGGPMSKLGVRADGVMVPCVQLPNMELGRINRDDLNKVWQHNPELNRFRQRSSMALEDFEYCRDCTYVNYCTGSCPAVADAMLKDPYHPSPDSCYKRFQQDGGVLPDPGLFPELGHGLECASINNE